jgi:anti-sigma factor RsiW
LGGSDHGDDFDLHAFVDGELDPERRRMVEDRLVHNHREAGLVEAWRRQNAALRAAFAHVAQEPAPAQFRIAIERDARSGAPVAPKHQGLIETGVIHWGRPSGAPTRTARRLEHLRRSRLRTVMLWLLAASSGIAAIGVAVVVFSGSAAPPQKIRSVMAASGFVARADLTYLTFARDTRPVEIGADHGGELAEWLRARTGLARAPDLSPSGLKLLGGRIAPGAATAAGFLLYETANAARVGLYFEPILGSVSAPAAPPRATTGLTAIEWRAAGLAFVLIGPLPPDEMQAAAERAAQDVLITPAETGGAKKPYSDGAN